MELPEEGDHVFRRHRLGQSREPDDVGEQHGDVLPPDRPEGLVVVREDVDQIGRKVARQVAARPFRRSAPAIDLAQLRDLVQGLAHRHFEIDQAVRRFGMSPYAETMIARTDA